MPRREWSRRIRTAAVVVAGASVASALAPAPGVAAEWAWPVRGSVITPYSNDNARPYAGGMHRGIDISAPVGSSVAASRAGKVTYAGTLGSAGLTIAIADGRFATSYLHLSSIEVRRGESVATGQKVGEVGTSGRRSASQPHLHFGVRPAGRDRFYLDPLTLLPPLPGAGREIAAPVAPVAAPLRVQPAPIRAEAKPVPVGPRPVPATAHPRTLSHPVAGRAPTLRPAPEGAPILRGPLVSLAGILLLAAVLASRFTRSDRSRASRRAERAQPAARTATVAVARVGSVSQVG